MIQEEIESAQRHVKTDAYQMSVGEIVNMYKEGELIINPNFQRLFRWEIGQKSKLIESLLLGIPIPSIFVFEREDSKWELIDGLQRVSTLLEFMGLLKSPDDSSIQVPSILEGTTYLPSLKNMVWEKSKKIKGVTLADQIELEKPFQLSVRRCRLTVEILKRPSSNSTKYDLFQRLNAGGTPANAQELRNCVVIMANPIYFKTLKSMSESSDFQTVISTTQDQNDRQKHLEYVARFLVLTFLEYDGSLDVEEYIDQGIISLAIANKKKIATDRFDLTFNILNKAHGKDALRRRTASGAVTGRVGWAAFECIAVGIANNIAHIKAKPDPIKYVKQRITAFWKSPDLDQFFSPGLRGTTRIQKTIPFGTAWFRQ